MTKISRTLFATTLSLGVVISAAHAQQRPPYTQGPGPAPYGYGSKNTAGRFDYYALVLSWSPTFCAGDTSGRNDMQCNPRGGRRYSFVLHGLWPQYEKGYPQDCPTRDRPFVPRPIIDRMLDIMPAPGLVIHEYKKHGTCSGLSPEGYFETARKLYSKVKIPARFDQPQAPQFVSPGEVAKEFLAANPDMPPSGLGVSCGRPGDRLREIRICFTRDGAFRPCGHNENQSRMCGAQKMYIPPVRGGGGGGVPRPGGGRKI